MISKSEPSIPFHRLIVYLLMGVGMIGYAVMNNNSTKTVKSGSGIFNGNDGTVGVEYVTGMPISRSNNNRVTDEVYGEDKKEIEANFDEFDADNSTLSQFETLNYRTIPKIRSNTQRSGDIASGVDDSSVNGSNVDDLSVVDSNAIDSNVIGSSGQGIIVSSLVSDNSNTDNANPNDANSGDDGTDEGQAQEVQGGSSDGTETDDDNSDSDTAKLVGPWNGRIEASTAESENGNPCAGADLSLMNLFFMNANNQYLARGAVRADAGYLNRGDVVFDVLGNVTADGSFNAASEPLHASYENPNYSATYSGNFSETQANGSWSDNSGCSGTWRFTKV